MISPAAFRRIATRALLAVSLFATSGATQGAASPASQRDAQFVASSRGEVYYWVGCSAWRRLSPANLRYFATRAQAEAAGYRVSTTRGCEGPGAAGAANTAREARPPRNAVDAAATRDRANCVVARVIDGDTIECAGGRRVRLLLIDTPERSQGAIGAQATATLARLAPTGSSVQLEFDVQIRDRYDRLLAYVYLPNGRMVNEMLLREGVAMVSVYPPNVRHVDRFRAIQDSARVARRGLWAEDAFACTPAEHRRGRC